MTDLSTTRLTIEDYAARGAQAYLDGRGVNEHGLPESSPARKAWQYGWHQQRVRSEQAGQLAECPP